MVVKADKALKPITAENNPDINEECPIAVDGIKLDKVFGFGKLINVAQMIIHG